jgi:hypothetical protein
MIYRLLKRGEGSRGASYNGSSSEGSSNGGGGGTGGGASEEGMNELPQSAQTAAYGWFFAPQFWQYFSLLITRSLK